MNVPASLRSDQVAAMPWIGWPLCTGLDGRNGVDQVAGITGIRTYIESHTKVTDYQLTIDEISTYAAALIKVDVVKEEWKLVGENMAVFMTVKAEVDSSYIDNQLSRIEHDKSLQQELKEAKIKLQKLESKYKKLQEHLATADGSNALLLRKERVDTLNEIDAVETRYRERIITFQTKKYNQGEFARKILQYIEIGMTQEDVKYILGKPDQERYINEMLCCMYYGNILVHLNGLYVTHIYLVFITEHLVTLKARGYNILEDGIDVKKMEIDKLSRGLRKQEIDVVKEYVLGE